MSSILDRIIELTSDLVRSTKPTGDDHGGQEILAKRLKPLGFTIETISLRHCDNLIALRGDGPEFFAFSGHTDVVPAGIGWCSDPFITTVMDDHLIGRGVADMKGAIAAWVVALEDFIAANPKTTLPIATLISGDEEVIAQGTPAILDTLAARGKKIRSCLVGEPSATAALGDCIKVGRRGSLNAAVRIVGIQGHTAYPHLASNPIHTACRIVSDLTSIDFDRGLPQFPLSPENEGWPASSLQCSGIESGIGGTPNLIPGEATLSFNIRYRPPLTHDSLIARLAPLFVGHACEVEVSWSGLKEPYDSHSGSLRTTVLEILHSEGLAPRITRDGGTSDGRFIAKQGAEVVELGPSNQTIHKVNERLKLTELSKLAKLYTKLLTKMANDW